MKKRVVIIVVAAIIVVAGIVGITTLLSRDNAERPLAATELLDLGEKYLLELNYEQALVQFLKVIEVEPMNPRGYTGAAEAYVGLGDTTSAEEILKKGFAVLPNNSEIQKKLAELDAVLEKTTPSFEQYIGVYSTNHREDRGDNPEHSAGYDLEIYSIQNDKIIFGMSYIGNYWSPIYETDEITATLNGNISDFQWTDSWGNEGHGTLRLENGNAIIRMIETISSDFNRASFDTGEEILLTLNDAVNNDASAMSPAPSPEQSLKPSLVNTDFSNSNHIGGDLLYEDGWIYYNKDGLHRIRIDGTEKQKLSQYNYSKMFYYDGWIYGNTLRTKFNLSKIKIDGSSEQIIKNTWASSIHVSGNWIYFYDFDLKSIVRHPINGTQTEILCTAENTNFYIHNDKIYYKDKSSSWSMNLDGSEKRKIYDENIWIKNFVDGLFYYTNSSGNLYRATDVFADVQEVFSGSNGNPNVTDEYIFIADWNYIYQLSFDGESRKIITELQGVANDIYIIQDYLFFYTEIMDEPTTYHFINLNGNDTNNLLRKELIP